MKTSDFLQVKLPFFPDRTRVVGTVLLVILFCLFLPWIAFTTGNGVITSIDPNERTQRINAPVDGFVGTWHVKEGQFLKKGDLIAELTDNDPRLLERYDQEKTAAKTALDSANLMRDTARINLDRQLKLFQDGLSARKEYEKAKIEYSKLEMEIAKAQVTLTKSESQYSKQSSQTIRAPRDGWVIRLLPGELGQLIKKGSPLAVFAPQVNSPAVEVWVDGNDSPMVQVGQTARVQFEGWPSVQIPGWPSVAINTFSGKVHLVDQASSSGGKFRVLIVPEDKWPSIAVLRLGLHAKAYVRLSDSFILREFWRRLNNIPALPEPYRSEIEELTGTGKKK
jgi:multidrug resistance efflux pump